MDSYDRDYIFVDAWLDVIWFSRLVTHLMPYWGIFPLSIEICSLPLICVIVPSYEIRVGLMISISFHRDSPGGLPLSRFIRLILSDVFVIFGWNYLKLMDSHIIISSKHMSGLWCIPIELFMSHQDRSDTPDAILGHFSLIWIWRWSFSHRFVAVFITWPRDIVYALLVITPLVFIEMSFRWNRMFGLWLPHYLWFFSRLLYWDHVGYPIRSFLLRFPSGSFDLIISIH